MGDVLTWWQWALVAMLALVAVLGWSLGAAASWIDRERIDDDEWRSSKHR